MREPRAGGRQSIPRPSGWLPGGPAPWVDVVGADRVTLTDIESTFAGRMSRLGGWEDERPGSAVLALFFDAGAGAGVETVFIRRASHMRRHAGEVAFPGGRHDSSDHSLHHTALRESQEEIGLDPSAVTIIGELDHLSPVVSPTYVKPVVGIAEDAAVIETLRPSPDEVDAILRTPLSRLGDPEVFWEERWPWVDGSLRSMSFFDLAGDTLWGATAVIVRRFLSELYRVRDPLDETPPE